MSVSRLSVLLGMSLAFSAVVAVSPAAEAAPMGLLDEAAAMAQARSTGSPVVVSARTNETTLITADPSTGMFVAELTARPVRVRDDAGGWREASARLVRASDGGWQTEAGVAAVRISGGGNADPLASLGSGSSAAELRWPDSLPEPTIEDTMATYPEVYPGVDLVVRADVDAVETYLVVKTAAAGRNPKVRNWSIPMTTPGLSAVQGPDGAQSLVDSQGVERIVMPKALMWDSTGKTAGLTRAADLIEEVAQTKSVKVGLRASADRLNALADQGFLDSPSTVYPVVIDPVMQAVSQTRVLRVTNDFSQWGSAVGDFGKIGYNGWSSPYYKSRMFYQFSWPASGLLPSQISKGEFRYTQVHSVQHSPCLSKSSTYPAVQARLADPIQSTDTWSDRQADSWHPQPAVLPNQKMAVGHMDYCGDHYTEVWNLTSALKTERQNYAGRSTVTVGLRSVDEGNKYGWKYYYNKSGTSPKLYLTYQLAPQKPQSVSATPLKSAGVTWSPTPTLSAKLLLTSGDACVTTSCLRGEFVIKNQSGSVVATLLSPAVASGGTASVVAPTLASGQSYTVTVRAKSVDTGMYSAAATPFGLTTDLLPSAPTNLKLANDGVTAVGSPVEVTTGQPTISANLAGGKWCPDETPACLVATFTITSQGMNPLTLVSAPGRSGDAVSVTVPQTSAIEPGTYTLTASTKHLTTNQVGPSTSLGFVRIAPKPATPVTGSVDTTTSGLLRLHVNNPQAGATYTWTTVFSPDDGSADQTSQVAGLQLDAQGDLDIPWDPALVGQVSVTIVCTAGGVDSDPSNPTTGILFE